MNKFGSLRQLFVGSAVLALVGVLSGCLETRSDQKEQDAQQVMQHEVSSLQQTTADTNSRFQDIEDLSRKQNGRIDVIENKLQKLSSKIDKALADSESKTKEKDDAYREEFVKLEAEINSVKEDLTALRDDQKRAAEAQMQAVAAQAAASAAAQAATAKNPFSAAEGNFANKKWKEAILDYEKYRKANPKGKLFSTATLKIGECFQELGLMDDASAFYEEVIAKFPNSKDAGTAGKRLKKLKKK